MPSKEEAEEWKKQLVNNAEQQILNLTDSDKFKNYLNTVAKFHSYSPRNIDLIYSQNADATQIAGFKQWKNDFNRSVNKGEKSIRISAPIIKKLTPEEQQRLNTTEERAIVGYRYIPVFDIEQTHGAPVPNVNDFVKENLSDHKNVSDLYNELKNYLNENTDLKVSEQNLDAQKGVKGFFQPVTNEIVISESEPDSALKLKTLYHEYAHSQLHGLTSEFKDRHREYKETQAEAVAYIAMQNIGVDTSEYSLGYVATWAQNKDVIHEALSEIQKVSNKVVDLSNELTEKLGLQQEKGNKISESLEEVAKEQLIVKADDPVQAVQKLYNNDLESAIQDSFTLSDVSEKEAQHFLKTVKWEDIVDMENSHDALKYHGNGLYSDEYIKPSSYNPYQENTKILNNDKQQGLSQQYKNLNKQINSNPDNNQHLKTQLTEVREKISQQTQQELKDYQKQNVDLKKPTQDSRQSFSR
ncbi:MAG: ArdcN domain-containing protein [Leuconostoc mesenteroides]|jgi:regulator of replication initiation timing|nr:LtrC [Leuconostoc mesenteroides]MCT3048038.1 LtrC [Leuconostoc mesenteroides]